MDDEDDEVVERDPSGRFCRSRQGVGQGRFKQVYKGFDEKQGIDVAWSKILQHGGQTDLDEEQMVRITAEMAAGLHLDHPNIIRCYRCWHDREAGCINLITEYFTSGNLREYCQRHKQLEMKAVRKWSRQILSGLNYLHKKDPPIIHGDLRCDKIYINGHSGEIKIGDLGLATLLPRRFSPAILPPNVDRDDQYTTEVDVFAFGLCVLELATRRRMDAGTAASWPELMPRVEDREARSFIYRCLGPEERRPTAWELLEDPFSAKRPLTGSSDSQRKLPVALPAAAAAAGAGAGPSSEPARSGGAEQADLRRRHDRPPDAPTDPPGEGPGVSSPGGSDAEGEACAVGVVKGEDYNFQFIGRMREGRLHFRLNMDVAGDEDERGRESRGRARNGPTAARDAPSPQPGSRRTIDFVYEAEDTPEDVAAEIGEEFELSDTDKDICAAALKEWLAKGSRGGE